MAPLRAFPVLLMLLASAPLASQGEEKALGNHQQAPLTPQERAAHGALAAEALHQRVALAAGFPARLAAAARELVGVPYASSPLGEGSGIDPDPRLRFDRFDCTTFVETVAALALAEGSQQVLHVLDALRYRGGLAAFERRHHLPAAQWLPAFQELGLLREASAEYAAAEVQVGSVWVRTSPLIWRQRSGLRRLELPAEAVPEGVFAVPYLAASSAGERRTLAESLIGTAEPLLLNVVRAPRRGVPVAISHQALLLPAAGATGEPRVLHASSPAGAVVDTSLHAFLAQQARRRSWPLLGINVQRWEETLPGPMAESAASAR